MLFVAKALPINNYVKLKFSTGTVTCLYLGFSRLKLARMKLLWIDKVFRSSVQMPCPYFSLKNLEVAKIKEDKSDTAAETYL